MTRNMRDLSTIAAAVDYNGVVPVGDVMLVRSARLVALHHHGAQRYGIQPYEVHLAAVERVLVEMAPYTPHLLAGAWLHDVLEDTPFTLPELYVIMPHQVAAIVDACTDGEGATREEKKTRAYHLIPQTLDAIAVKLADRIANVESSRSEGRDDLIKMYNAEKPRFDRSLRGSPATFDVKPMWDRLEVALRGP